MGKQEKTFCTDRALLPKQKSITQMSIILDKLLNGSYIFVLVTRIATAAKWLGEGQRKPGSMARPQPRQNGTVVPPYNIPLQ
jgi:hypothetical protein